MVKYGCEQQWLLSSTLSRPSRPPEPPFDEREDDRIDHAGAEDEDSVQDRECRARRCLPDEIVCCTSDGNGHDERIL